MPKGVQAGVDADRDWQWSTVLRSSIDLQEAIIVETAYAAAEPGDPISSGQPGGANSTEAASPSAARAGDAATADRAAGTVMRGDIQTNPVTWDRGALFR